MSHIPDLIRRTSLEGNSSQPEAAVFTRDGEQMRVIINPHYVASHDDQQAYRRRGALLLALQLTQERPGDMDEHLYRLEEFFAHTR